MAGVRLRIQPSCGTFECLRVWGDKDPKERATNGRNIDNRNNEAHEIAFILDLILKCVIHHQLSSGEGGRIFS